jgi:ribosomal protein S18 acetylase RimI-like enzyme
MKDLIIRPFKTEDRRQLAALMASSFREDWLKIVRLPDKQMAEFLLATGEIFPLPFEGYMVAERGGEVVGMIKLKWAGQQVPGVKPPLSSVFQHGLVTAAKLLVMRYLFPEKPAKGACHVSELAVLERARGKGIATELLLCGKKIARQKGFQKYTLNVDARNQPAFHLYRKPGFSIEKSHRNLLAKWLFNMDRWHFMSQPLDAD